MSVSAEDTCGVGCLQGGSNLGGGSGGLGGTVGGNLGGAWGSVLCCSMGSCIVAQVCLGGVVEVGLGVPVAAKMSASCRMESMV